MNRWIAQHVDDYRVWDELTHFANLRDDWGFLPASAHVAEGAFHWCDAVYTHTPLRGLAPKGTFCLVVLRKPIDRIISQVADWRRDAATADKSAPEDIRSAMKDAADLPLRKFLERHAFGPRLYLFDNYQTRALARRYPERETSPHARAMDLLPQALKSLSDDYDLVGLHEKSHLVRAAMASALGLAYEPVEGEHLNVTNSRRMLDAEVADAMDILQDLTTADDILYRSATEIFATRHEKAATRYDESRFDRKHAADAVTRLRPTFDNGNTVFSVRDPLIASGLHGRDASGSSACTVWSGPSNRFVLYMPVPSGADLTLNVWVRGLANPHMLDDLTVTVDDKPAQYSIQAAPKWAARIVVPALTNRSFVKLALSVREAVSSTDDAVHVDLRKRGIAFGAYGWRFNTPS